VGDVGHAGGPAAKPYVSRVPPPITNAPAGKGVSTETYLDTDGNARRATLARVFIVEIKADTSRMESPSAARASTAEGADVEALQLFAHKLVSLSVFDATTASASAET
jgi:hypothetical protein